MLEPPTIVHDDGVLQIAYSNDLFVERWMRAGRMPQFEAIHRHHLAYLRRKPGAWSSLLIEVRGSTLAIPNAEERALIAERHNGMAPSLAAAAMVIDAPGFVASMTRAIISTMTLANRTPYPYRIFSNVDEGLRWLAPRRNVPKPLLLPPEKLIEWHAALAAQLSPAA